MAATDIKSVLELLRAKVHSADSSTSLDELNNMIKAAQLAHTPMIRHYDSDGSLPTATSSEERLAFITSTGSIKMNNGRRWESTTSTASSSGSESQTLRGTQYGYFVGGYPNGSDFGIQQYSFTSDGNATKVGSQSGRKQKAAGFSSATHAYAAGGDQLSVGNTNKVEKFSFATLTDAAATTDLDLAQFELASTHTASVGYTMNGGYSGNPYASPSSNLIQKYDMTSDTPSTLTATMVESIAWATGHGSATHGYTSGGQPASTQIAKFAFASESTNATDVGDLTTGHNKGSGHSSETHGYNAGHPNSNAIDKFPFAADGNATDVGDLTVGRYFGASAGAQSTTHAYCAGGGWPAQNVIDKFSFSADGNATDVGNLTSGTMMGSTAQN